MQSNIHYFPGEKLNSPLYFTCNQSKSQAPRTVTFYVTQQEKELWNGGLVPYGYRNVDKKLEIDEKEAEGVRKIYQIFLETQSLAESRRRINQLGYRTREKDIRI